MNPEFPHLTPEELEVRITTLLLGELSAVEAAAVREQIAANAQLQQLHDELKKTIGLVEQTTASVGNNAAATAKAPTLSYERREKLFAAFKTHRLQQSTSRRTRRELLAIAAMVLGLVAVTAVMFRSQIFDGLHKEREKFAEAKYYGAVGRVPVTERVVVQHAMTEPVADSEGKDVNLMVSGGTFVAHEPELAGIVTPYDAAAEPLKLKGGDASGKTPLGRAVTDLDLSSTSPGNPTASSSERFRVAANNPTRIALPSLPPATTPGGKPDELKSQNDWVELRTGAAQDPVLAFSDDAIEGFALNGEAPKPANLFGNDVVFHDTLKDSDADAITMTNGTTGLAGLGFGAFGSGGGGFGGNLGGGRPGIPGQPQNGGGAMDYSRLGEPNGPGSTPLSHGEKKDGLLLDSAATSVSQDIGGPIEHGYWYSGSGQGVPNRGEGLFQQSSSLSIEAKKPVVQDSWKVSGEVQKNLPDSGKYADVAQKLEEAPKADPQVVAGGYQFRFGQDAQNRSGSRGNESSNNKAILDAINSFGSTPGKDGTGLAKNDSVPYQTFNGRTGVSPQFGRSQSLFTLPKPAEPDSREKAPATDFGLDGETKRAEPVEVSNLRSELEKANQIKERLAIRIASDEIDAKTPKTATVEIIDRAEAQPSTENSGFFNRLQNLVTRKAESKVRVKAEKDSGDVGGLEGKYAQSSFDPYWVQTEFEAIQSKAVLSQVVDKLDLGKAWAEQKGDQKPLTSEEAYQQLKKNVTVKQDPKTSLLDIRVKSEKPEEAARIANTIAETYKQVREQQRLQLAQKGIKSLQEALRDQEETVARLTKQLDAKKEADEPAVSAQPKPASAAPIPQPDLQTVDNAFSTFSLNVSDVSFKLAAASLEKGVMPDAASIRTEEFINAFDYRDPEAPAGVPIAFNWDRAAYPFAHNRDILRFSLKTAARGREPGKPLNLVLLLDNSGSMERADRVQIIRECLRVLAGKLQPQDRVSAVSFSRQARLWLDGIPGDQASDLPQRIGSLTPEGGTNLEEAMRVAYQAALKHYMTNGANRIVLLTDGAANLGNVNPDALKKSVESHRMQGIALDCFGIGWEGYNDDLLEVLSRNGDGRYGFVNTPEAASTEFASQALQVAASDVKVQVEFNPRRVSSYRQIGYAKHQLKKEQFRDNTVDAAEIGAAEAGNALYVVDVNPSGEGPLATVRVRYKVPGTSEYHEKEWPVPYNGAAKSLDQATPAIRLASIASAFSEWLAGSPYAGEVTPSKLLNYLPGAIETFNADPRPKKLEWMIREASRLSGNSK